MYISIRISGFWKVLTLHSIRNSLRAGVCHWARGSLGWASWTRDVTCKGMAVSGGEFLGTIAETVVLFLFLFSFFFPFLFNLSLYMHGSETSIFSPNTSLALITSVCRCDRKCWIVHKGMNLDFFSLKSVHRH